MISHSDIYEVFSRNLPFHLLIGMIIIITIDFFDLWLLRRYMKIEKMGSEPASLNRQ